jgi:hypothetical protein
VNWQLPVQLKRQIGERGAGSVLSEGLDLSHGEDRFGGLLGGGDEKIPA